MLVCKYIFLSTRAPSIVLIVAIVVHKLYDLLRVAIRGSLQELHMDHTLQRHSQASVFGCCFSPLYVSNSRPRSLAGTQHGIDGHSILLRVYRECC